MKVGIVTVTFNSANVLPDFVQSLKAQSYTDSITYIVDNSSKDESCAYVQNALPEAVLICNSDNRGFAAGTNQGIRRALDDGCEAVLPLNNDVIFGPELIQQLVEGLKFQKSAMVAPMMYYFEPKDKIWAAGGTLQTWAGCRAIHRGQYETDRGQYATPCRISFAPFCCVLIRSSVFQQAGFLDEQYFAYVEDADFLYRCSRHNLTLWFIPQARLWHKVSSLTGDASPFSLRYGARNRIYFLKKHKSAATRWFYYLLLVAYYFLRYAFGLDSRERCGAQLRGCVEGLRIPLNQDRSSSRGAE